MRKILQQRTATLHATLERRVEELAYFSSVERYRAWLARSYVFQDRVREIFSGYDISAIIPASAFEERLHCLARDLEDFGHQVPDRFRSAGPVVSDDADAIGVLYVTEGATLGARLLVVRAQSLGCGAVFGARYLTTQAAGFSAWRNVVAALDGRCFSEAERVRAERASCATFELATRCFGECDD